MKVLICAYACMPNRGREEGFGWNNAIQIAQLGHEVWVINLNTAECLEHPLSKIPNLHFVHVAYPILKHVPEGRYKYLHFLRYFAWKVKAEQIALQLDKEHNFDIIHHLTIASLQGGPSFTNLKKPLVFGPVGGGQTAPKNFKRYFFGSWFDETLRSFVNCKLIALNPLLHKALKRCDLVLATNQETVQLSQKMTAKNVELFLDSGLPPEYFAVEPPKRLESPELRLLWLSRIEPRKGLFLALEALSKVNSAIPFKLTIIGDGSLDSYVPQWIEQFNLETKVNYCGSLPWTEVQDAYLNNDVFLFTSLRDSYGSVLLEAMSQALPIITLNHHGARDFVPNKGAIKVSVTNPDQTVNALAQAVEYMYKNPQKRLEMGRASYEFAKQQSWKNKAITITQYYEKILQNYSGTETVLTPLIVTKVSKSV
ncbi:glycosyltransferase family 4 protein [Rivularia sp. UHCC 0363]|uniref:glycosyltransferase family 4 protein n=1 Tax=Rivularia sp. UHCC 0363 TaxID=3110244 RepID=UPI002B1ED4B5|nr:glycosyltransferase family 4 protein [Rivularia sp. UHCC 0363]MEA5597407.1 glycosyltransferase family 4 protein [Rivularia sp. UHCC 0363]